MADLIMYQTEDGSTKIEVEFHNDTAWLTQDQMAELFQRDRTVITKHINNIFNEGELNKDETMRKFGISVFSTKPTNLLPLLFDKDVITALIKHKY
ncbi:MAG: hypothetical protein ILP02_02990 [Clostridia bacterium]|nr:hypothetical protein [Clostridia bacterium]